MKTTLFTLIAAALIGCVQPAAAETCDGAPGSACGTLYRVPNLGNFDFYYPTDLSSTYGNLMAGAVLKLQARFTWGGTPGREITADQHAIVAFTNRGATNNMVNTAGQMFWTHGVGAYVGERGLELETWFRDDPNGDGFNDEPANAYVWSQDGDRCVSDVRGTITAPMYCLGDKPSDAAYITSAPDFKLRAGVGYWVRVEVERSKVPGWGLLRAQLVEEACAAAGCEARVVQRAAVAFDIAKHFPMNWQPLEATVARTPGSRDEPTIKFAAFNNGF